MLSLDTDSEKKVCIYMWTVSVYKTYSIYSLYTFYLWLSSIIIYKKTQICKQLWIKWCDLWGEKNVWSNIFIYTNVSLIKLSIKLYNSSSAHVWEIIFAFPNTDVTYSTRKYCTFYTWKKQLLVIVQMMQPAKHSWVTSAKKTLGSHPLLLVLLLCFEMLANFSHPFLSKTLWPLCYLPLKSSLCPTWGLLFWVQGAAADTTTHLLRENIKKRSEAKWQRSRL